jgi:D-alanyl-D-alanine carboxypeptidase/D-alanyl-D-alanine-endopeptidase (penicillin-binding protein 4)
MKKLLAILLLSGCATFPPPSTEPVTQKPFDAALWAILIEDDGGQTLYAHNADKLMIPASNRKLFAAVTIATCLGIDSQLYTNVYRAGEDLILRGDGDPSLGSWRFTRENDFDGLARTLRDLGVTSVRDLVVDVSAFDRVLIPGAWKYGNLGSDYSAPVDAITWGENELPGDRAVADPALHAGNALREALELRGVAVGSVRVNTEPREWGAPMATLASPFIGDLLRPFLKNSHNLYGEMLLKRTSGGTYPTAFARERATLTSDAAVPAGTFRFADGSGLAPDNLVTARATVAVLRWMNHPSRRAFWWDTLATPNQEGTLSRRLIPLEGRFRGKTGTINGVNALSGIIAMPDGGYRYFVAMVNHHIGDGDDAVKIIDGIAMLAATPGKPLPEQGQGLDLSFVVE